MEKLIDDAKLNELLASRMGPTVTKYSIEAQISGETFLQPEGTTLTICVLTLANGFTVTGVSACADPANFDEDIGRKLARDNAFNKIWELEGYLLKERIHRSAEIAASVQPEPDFIGRLELEREDLAVRLSKLQTFLAAGGPEENDAHRSLLIEQEKIMEMLLDVLNRRLEDIANNPPVSDQPLPEPGGADAA